MSRERKRAGQGSGEFGVLLIDKPPGPTSHDVVAWVRWALRERAVGHCGTLDPPASGLLVVCVGAATKLVEYLTGVDKRYRARFVLGRSTTTADAQGETLSEREVPEGLESLARERLLGLRGELELPPPAVSAVRLDGRRAHELARAGEAPKLPPRAMTVAELELDAHGRAGEMLWIDAELRVTKGTYIRSLAEELGRRLQLPAHLGSLRRTACGQLRVDDPRVVTGLRGVELPPLPQAEGAEPRPPKWRIELPDEPSQLAARGAVPHAASLGLSAEGGVAKTCSGPTTAASRLLALDENSGARRRDGLPHGLPDARERAAELLRAKLCEPWRVLPFEVGEHGGEGPHRPLFARLLQGQRLRADAGTLAALALRDEPGLCAVVDRAAGQLIVLRREQGRLAPARVLRFSPPIDPPGAH